MKNLILKIKAFIKSPEFFLITTIFLVAVVLILFFSITLPVEYEKRVEYIEDDNFKLKESLRFPGTIEKIVVKANPVTDNDNVALLRLKIENARILNFFLSDDMLSMPACEGGTMFTDTEICVDIASKSPLQKDQVLGEIQLQWGFNAKGVLKGLEANAYYNLNSDKLSNYTIQPLEVSLFGGLSFTGESADTNTSTAYVIYYCTMNYPFNESTKNCVNRTTGEHYNLMSKSSMLELGNALPKQEVKVFCPNGYTFNPTSRECFNTAGDKHDATFEPGKEVLCQNADCSIPDGSGRYYAPFWNCANSWCDPCNLQRWTCAGHDIYKCEDGDIPVKKKCTGGCEQSVRFEKSGGRLDDYCVKTDGDAKTTTTVTPTPITPTGTSSKLACGDTGCLSDSDCVTGAPDYACRMTEGVGKCILNCKEGETRVDDCACVSTDPAKREGICGPIDVDGNGKLDYVDLADFAKSYNIICKDASMDITKKDIHNCGRKDTDDNGKIDYMDLANFATRYHTVKNSCSLK